MIETQYKPNEKEGVKLIYTILNSKGGVGKTTVAINLAAALAEAGKRVLVVDTDVQDNVRIWLGVEESAFTLFDVLAAGVKLRDAVVQVRERIDIVQSGGDPFGAVPYLLMQESDAVIKDILRDALADVADEYDYILIDSGPSRSLLHTLALVACDGVLVPVNMEWLAVVGSAQVQRAVRDLQREHGVTTDIELVIPTFLDRRRSRICDDILDDLKSAYGNKLSNPIRVNSKLSEAPAYQKTTFEMRDRRGVEDFSELGERVTRLEQKKKRG